MRLSRNMKSLPLIVGLLTTPSLAKTEGNAATATAKNEAEAPAAATAGSATASAPAQRDDARLVVARINGQPIYNHDIAPDVDKQLSQFKRFGARPVSPEIVQRAKRKAIDNRIAAVLLEQQSTTKMSPETESRVTALLGEEKRRPHFAGKTDEEIRDVLRRKLAQEAYLKQQGLVDFAIPEAEVRKYYESIKSGLMRPETVHARHILVGVPDGATAEQKKQARDKAEQARSALVGGKDFAKLAQEVSTCNSKSVGGDLGYIEKGYMPPQFDTVAFTVPVHTLSPVVETRHGFHIIEVLDKKPTGAAPFKDVRDFLTKYLQGEQRRERVSAHIATLRAAAKVEILLD